MYKIRLMVPSDKNFIYRSWLQSYKHDSPMTVFIGRDFFFKIQQKIVDTIFSRDDTKTIIACDENDEEIIFGFLVYQPKIIHYVYVKEPFRKLGIATTLLKELGNVENFQGSHFTYKYYDLWDTGKISIDYNPRLLQGMVKDDR